MNKVISMKELMPGLPKVVDEIDTKMKRYIVSKHGKPVVIMLNVEDFNSLQETINVLADTDLMKSIKSGIDEIRNNKTVSWDKVKEKVRL